MTVVDLARINDLTELELDALAQRLDARRRAPRAPGPLVNVRGEVISPRAAAGRVQVAPGQTIASTWGNQTYDQTLQVFASAADRDAQWPAPLDGAHCFLLDSATPWIRRAGAWAGLPLGRIASALGPASIVNAGATLATVVTLTATVVAGRRYAISAYAFAQQTGAVGNSYWTLGTPFNIDSGQGRFAHFQGLPVASYLTGSATYLFTPATTGPLTWTIGGLASAGTLQTSVNQCSLILEDIGS